MNTTRSLLILVLSAQLTGLSARAHPADDTRAVAEEMAAAANNLLATLTPEQAARATYPLNDNERFNWHFIPRERKGLPFKEMTPEQKHLAHALLSTALSHRGYLKASTIMSLEQVLRDLEQGKGPPRDPERYFVTIFGKADALSPTGISAAKLNAAQTELVWQLIKEYVYRYRPEIADHDLKKIEQAGTKNLYFAWAGSIEPKEGHYYRVQGPTFLMEYDN